MTNIKTNNKLLWLVKLAALTIAIFWFITDGLTKGVGETIGVDGFGNNQTVITISLIILLVYIVFVIGRSIYQKYTNKPKSYSYKKYRETR